MTILEVVRYLNTAGSPHRVDFRDADTGLIVAAYRIGKVIIRIDVKVGSQDKGL